MKTQAEIKARREASRLRRENQRLKAQLGQSEGTVLTTQEQAEQTAIAEAKAKNAIADASRKNLEAFCKLNGISLPSFLWDARR